MVKVRVAVSAAGVAAAGLQGPGGLAERLEQVFARFQGTREELIPLLQRVQEELGFLPDEAMLRIARFLRVPESAVYAVATFYAQFRFTPIGKRHVMVCRGTSCHVRGAPRIPAGDREATGNQGRRGDARLGVLAGNRGLHRGLRTVAVHDDQQEGRSEAHAQESRRDLYQDSQS